MFEKLKNMLKMSDTKQKTYNGGGHAYGLPYGSATMSYFKSGSYDNTFPNISKIADSFMTIEPYAVDISGKRLKVQPKLIDSLYFPNKQMSGVDFFEALMVMTLVHPVTYVLCWREEGGKILPGGKITKDNIAGFTFLEYPQVEVKGDKVFYRKGSRLYSDDEVLALSMNINPYSVVSGYSPSVASKTWATIDDYIAAYQAGFFKNGAVPAGEFIVTAPTAEDFEKIVDKLESTHKGIGKNNNVVYVHKPVDTVSGKPLNAQVEWVPYSSPNKELSLKDLFEQANRKLDMAFGVPAEIKGFLQNSNYASANVADYIFAKYVVYPKTLKVWAKFTHEMNRITKGLGYALSFNFPIPELADEEYVKAQTREVDFRTLNSAITAGFSIKSSVKALGLPASFADLEKVTVEQAEDSNVAEPKQVEELADQLDTSIAKSCCHHDHKIKQIETQEEEDLASIAREHMNSQIERTEAEGFLEQSDDESDEFAKKLLELIALLLLVSGKEQNTAGISLLYEAGVPTDNIAGYELTETLKNSYEQYLRKVAKSYDADTAESIRRVLDRGVAENWDKETLGIKLREIMQTDEWRVQRLAVSEIHRAQNAASLDAMTQLQKEADVEIKKIWKLNPHTPNPCADCIAMDGKELPLGDSFIKRGDTLPVSNRVNDFVDIEAADMHPNCHCRLMYKVVTKPKSVKVTCPTCKRYMFESSNSSVKNFICQNSKCKKHWDIEVKNGNISAKENKNLPPSQSIS